jgi:hypothetical protein
LFCLLFVVVAMWSVSCPAGVVLIVLVIVHCCCHVWCLLPIAGGYGKGKEKYASPLEKSMLMYRGADKRERKIGQEDNGEARG